MKQNKEIVAKIKNLSFKEAMIRLEEISTLLNSQQIELESMIQIYEEANILKNYCQKKLDEAQMKIEIINQNNPNQNNESQ